MNKIKTRTDLKKLSNQVLCWLRKNDLSLLDKLLPAQKNSSLNKQKLLKLSIEGLEKPEGRSNKLAVAFHNYTNPKSLVYDKNFTEQIKNLNPNWLKSAKERYFEKSLKKLLLEAPTEVSFKEGQRFEGMNKKYIFIDELYGEFTANANNLKTQSWKIGYTGHPKRRGELIRKRVNKKVKNLDTNVIFNSIKEASASLGGNIGITNVCAGRSKTAGGYRWAYCDENGNVIKKEKNNEIDKNRRS